MKLTALAAAVAVASLTAAAWAPQGDSIKTRWAASVDPLNVHTEYPRPQLERARWQSLNGLWDYAITTAGEQPAAWEGQILVPFPIESSLSGVMKHVDKGHTLWYRRDIEVPAAWKGDRVMLNFGAADYRADVYLGGTGEAHLAATHTGGHTPFTVDITPWLTDGGKATLYVCITDETDHKHQPTGKQRRKLRGKGDIFYTSSTGLWQSVWMEPVAATAVKSFKLTPDVDASTLTVAATLDGKEPHGSLRAVLTDGGIPVASALATVGPHFSHDGNLARVQPLTLGVPHAKLWSPTSPHLYGLTLYWEGRDGSRDTITSYAAMRKIEQGPDARGIQRLLLNGKPLFQFGPLDQGYWPDGLLTAPCDEALRYDLEMVKKMGFNMVRKHMKVEPDRWYAHCDSLGLLVWQDMPSAFLTDEGDWTVDTWYRDHECTQDPDLEQRFKAEWQEIIEALYNHPSIVVWTPFNERWGQFKTAHIAALTEQLDPTRLVNPASGGNHYKMGGRTFVDQHTYEQPVELWEGIADASRPMVLGEYGGLGRNIPSHRWLDIDTETYNTYPDEEAITAAYEELVEQIVKLSDGSRTDLPTAFSAAVYTQLTDVETEVNGLMTYDRAMVKFDLDRLLQAARRLTGLWEPGNGD